MFRLNANSTMHSRILPAVIASLALHGFLLGALRSFQAALPASQEMQRSLAVFLRPLTHQPEAAQAGIPPPPAQPQPAQTIRRSAVPQQPVPAEMAPLENASTAPNSPRFDLDNLRQQAREHDRSLRRQTLTPPPEIAQTSPPVALERETTLSAAVTRAKRPDCRTAYSGGGLFAIPLLLFDTARNKGCQW